jgi:predicted dehydrogenase
VDSRETLRVAVSGSGHRSRTVWQKHISELPGFELVGVQDIEPASLSDVPEPLRYSNIEDMLARVRPDILVACPVNAAHAEVVEAGLLAGCHVLAEKPLTTELADAVRLAGLAEEKDLVLGVVQNWRTKSVGRALRAAIAEGLIGEVGYVFFRYLRDRELDRLPAYLFAEPDPLLLAVAIHHVDLFRFVLGQEIVRVDGRGHRPAWSRYEWPSVVQLWLETEAGVAISYTATFSARGGDHPQESLQVEGELGSLCNESEYSEPPLLFWRRGEVSPLDLTDGEPRDVDTQYAAGDTAILRNFSAAIRSGEPLVASARDNLGTLATIEAARVSIRENRVVETDEMLHASL